MDLHIGSMKSLIILFPVHLIVSQDPILKMWSSNPGADFILKQSLVFNKFQKVTYQWASGVTVGRITLSSSQPYWQIVLVLTHCPLDNPRLKPAILADSASLNSLYPGDLNEIFIKVTFKQILVIDAWGVPCEIGPYSWVSGNGLVPSGNKPLPGSMLTQIYVSTLRRCRYLKSSLREDKDLFILHIQYHCSWHVATQGTGASVAMAQT